MNCQSKTCCFCNFEFHFGCDKAVPHSYIWLLNGASGKKQIKT